MRDRHPGRVEDYTVMCLWMGFINLLWIMAAIWVSFGLLPVLVLALALNHAITHLGVRRAVSRQRYAPRPRQ